MQEDKSASVLGTPETNIRDSNWSGAPHVQYRAFKTPHTNLLYPGSTDPGQYRVCKKHFLTSTFFYRYLLVYPGIIYTLYQVITYPGYMYLLIPVRLGVIGYSRVDGKS